MTRNITLAQFPPTTPSCSHGKAPWFVWQETMTIIPPAFYCLSRIVIGFLYQHEILRAVVGLLPVFVVDAFCRFKGAAKNLFHEIPMFIEIRFPYPDTDVSIFHHGTTALPMIMAPPGLVKRATRSAAIVCGSNSIGIHMKFFAAIIASLFNHIIPSVDSIISLWDRMSGIIVNCERG